MKRHSPRSEQIVKIREANEEDTEEIENIINSVASEKSYVVPERSRRDWDEAIREIKSRKGSIIVAQVDAEMVGVAHLVRGKFEKNRHVGFLGISILKRFRKKGIGTAMMKHMMSWAGKQKGLEKISLTAFSTNKAAIDLYRKFGFMIEGISKRQYKIEGRYVDEVVMGKFLN